MNRKYSNRSVWLMAILLVSLFFIPEGYAQFWKPKTLSKEIKAKMLKPKKARPLNIESISEIEPNNTQATATILPLDSVMEAVIDTSGDMDFFRITVADSQTLSIDIDAEIFSSYLDSYLELFDSAGTLLAENDDEGEWLDSKIIYTFSVGGNYFIKVTDLGDSGGEDYYYNLRAYEFQTQGAQNMVIAHSWPVPNAAYLIKKEENILFTVEANAETMFSVFKTWDISDIYNPILLDTLFNDGMISDFQIAFNKAYLAMTDDEMGIKILDISNPSDIQIDTMLDIGETTGLFILGNKLYETGDGFTVRDLSNPASPVPLWSFNLEDEDGSFIAADENYVYFTATDGLLHVVDQTTHLEVGNEELWGDRFSLAYPYIYASSGNFLVAIDISNPMNPEPIGMFGSPDKVFSFSTRPNSGYLSAGMYGIQYIACSDPSAMSLEGYYFSTPDFFPFTNVVENDLVFAASGYIEGWNTTSAANRIVILKNELIGIPELGSGNKPNGFELFSNYPNPFNPSTTIRYKLNSDTRVSLKIYNLLGQEIRTLASNRRPAGIHEVIWDGKNDKGTNVSSGLYLYRLQIGNQAITRKMTLMK